jgi:hypothetical protein
MLRTTFPDEEIAWKKEVERLLHQANASIRQLNQLIGPASSPGVVIGGNPPERLECMQFEFDIQTEQPECAGCDTSLCKTVTVSEDIMNGAEVLFAAGDYTLTRIYQPDLPCRWNWTDPEDSGRFINFISSTNVAVTFQSSGGSLYYADDTSCTTLDHTGGDPGYTDYPESVTVADVECEEDPETCGDTLHIKAEIKWNASQHKWIQSYFAVEGDEGGGAIETTFNGATFTIDIEVDHPCFTGAATYHAPVFLDDLCRTITARRATAANDWPTSITGRCVNCTPHTTTTESTTTESTTTDSTTTESTTTDSTTTDSTTTDSTTTDSTTTGSTTTDSTTTDSTTTGSSSSSTESTTSTTTTGSTSSTTPGPCTGNCNYIGVPDSCAGCGCGPYTSSPTGFSWSGNGSDCSSGCGCDGQLCGSVVDAIGWPTFNGQTASIPCE